MIVSWLLGMILSFGSWLLGLLPSGLLKLPDLGPLASHLADLNYFLPISELFVVTVGVMALTPALLFSTLLTWIVVGLGRGGSPRA